MMNINETPESKIFFTPGDIVEMKHDVPNKPRMVVVKIERSIIKKDETNYLRGVKCRWFTSDGHLQEAVFSTKDLKKV